jgi:hypothetical protein
MVTNPNQFGKLSLEELTEFEKTNKIDLPQDYKKFLLTYNGGEPLKNTNQTPSTVVRYVLGMHNGDYDSSLYKYIDMFGKRLPFSTFPIATDPLGNLFIMSMHPDNYGQIFFWEHEGEPEIQDGHYIDNISFVAWSFNEFISKLN